MKPDQATLEKSQYLSNLIAIRNHLSVLLNGTRNAIRPQDVKPVGALIQTMDTEILTESLALYKSEVPAQVEVDVAQKIAEAKASLKKTKTKKNSFVRPE